MRKIKRLAPTKEINDDLKSKQYNTQNVYDRLSEMSFDACYICGRKMLAAEIEHRIAKTTDSSKTYEWNNLFYSCRLCNVTKNYCLDRKKITILDPTQNTVHSEKCLIYKIDDLKVGKDHLIAESNEKYFEELKKEASTVLYDSLKSESDNTALLINRVFGEDTERSKHMINRLNADLDQKLSNFFKLILKYMKNRTEILSHIHLKESFVEEFNNEINGSSDYIGIKRSYIRNEIEDAFLIDLITI